MNYIVMGPQGSGKTTQARLLAQDLELPHFNVGDFLYYLSLEKSSVGRRIKKAMRGGLLVDEDLVLKLVTSQLQKEQYQKGFVLDGFPRRLSSAERFEVKINEVFYLRVSDEVNIKRLVKRGREDDTPVLIRKRLAIYHQQTEPVLAYYRRQGILAEIDGERPIEIIHQDIMKRIDSAGRMEAADKGDRSNISSEDDSN